MVEKNKSSCFTFFSSRRRRRSRAAPPVIGRKGSSSSGGLFTARVWPSDEDGGRWGVAKPGIDGDTSFYISTVKDKFNTTATDS